SPRFLRRRGRAQPPTSKDSVSSQFAVASKARRGEPFFAHLGNRALQDCADSIGRPLYSAGQRARIFAGATVMATDGPQRRLGGSLFAGRAGLIAAVAVVAVLLVGLP